MKLTDAEVTVLVANHSSYNSIMISLGYTAKGGGVQTRLKKRVEALKLDTTHFKGQAHGKSATSKHKLEDVLTLNSIYHNTAYLKLRLIREGILKNECTVCNLTDWQGQPIVLQLDHINGDNRDNRLSNLRLLCPNCHSQTITFAGRNANKRATWI